MKRREVPFSALILLIIGVLMLLSWLFLHPLFEFFVYFALVFLYGETIAESGFLYFLFVVLLSFIITALIPILSICFSKSGSERAYIALKKTCKVLLTVYISAVLILVFILACGNAVGVAWLWCVKYGSIPLMMLLYLVPIFLLFYWKISIRVSGAVGNTALAVCFWASIRMTIMMLFKNTDTDISLLICAVVFVFLWLFEQIQRNGEGTLSPFTRILLTLLALLASILTFRETVRFAVDIIKGGFAWASFNSFLFALPVLAMFVIYAIKVNRNMAIP